MEILSFILFLLFILLPLTTPQSPYDFFINPSANCASPNICLGTQKNPYSTLNLAIPALFSQLKAIKLDNLTTINIRLLGDFFLYKFSLRENSSFFNNWENLLQTKLTVNIMPNDCYLSENCNNKTIIFLMKSENMTFYLPTSFTMRNIIFDARDLNLNSSSPLFQNVCYSSVSGCCSETLMNDPNSDCYLTSSTLTRTQKSENSLFLITANSSSFILQNCTFQYFLSKKPDLFYNAIITMDRMGAGGGWMGGGGGFRMTYPNFTFSLQNTKVYWNYFSKYWFNVDKDNSTGVFDNFNVINYNPFYFMEATTQMMMQNQGGNTLLSVKGKNGLFTISNGYFYYVQTVFISEKSAVIINSTFILKSANLTASPNFPKAVFRLGINNQNSLSLTVSLCKFKFPLIQFNDPILNEYSLVAINSQTYLEITDSDFMDLWLQEAQLISAKSYNNISFSNINFMNISHTCLDLPSLCNFPLLSFSSYNNLTFKNVNFTYISWSQDQGLIRIEMNNSLKFSNCYFSHIVSSQNFISIIHSTNNNKFCFKNGSFSDISIDQGFFLFELGPFDYFKISNYRFLNNLLPFFSPISSLSSSAIFRINSTQFLNMSLISSAFILSENAKLTLLNSTVNNIFFSESGFITISGKNCFVEINISFFSNISASSQGSVIFFSNFNEALILETQFSNCSSRNQDGGVFYLNNFNNLTVINCRFFGGGAYYGGVLSAYMENSLQFYNTSFDSTIAINNGGCFYLINLNQLNLTLGTIKKAGSLTGKAGFIIMIIQNKINITDFTVNDVFAYAEGGFLFGESNNFIYLLRLTMKNISSYADGGCIFLKETNNMTIFQSSFDMIYTSLSGGFINIKNHNIILLNSSKFMTISCKKDGGFAYLENDNFLGVYFSPVGNLTSYTGAFLAGSDNNRVKITNCTLFIFQSLSVAGGFWLFNNNSIILKFSSIVDIWSHASDGGGAYLSKNNNIVLNYSYISDVRSEDSGGLISLDLNNTATIVNCELWNLTSMLNGVLAIAKKQNILNFTANNINLYFYFGLFYFNFGNTMYFDQNMMQITNGLYNPLIFYSNSSNILFLRSNTIIIRKSLNPLKYYFFQLLFENSLTLINNLITLDKCYTFLEAYQGSQISIQKTLFQKMSTVNLKLIYLEDSILNLFQVNFKDNDLMKVIEANNCSITIKNMMYIPSADGSRFFQGSNSTLYLTHVSFNNKNMSLSSQVIFGQILNLKFNDVTFLMIISKNSSSCIEIYDSSLKISKSFFALNKAELNGGVLQLFRNFANSLNNNSISMVIKKSILIKNRAKNMGGCIYVEKFSQHQLIEHFHLEFYRNHFIMNKAFRGGVLAGENINCLTMRQNKMIRNKAKTRNTFNKSKGGVIYVHRPSPDHNDLLSFNVSANIILFNKAEIGGVFYFHNYDFSNFLTRKNRFHGNNALFYGKELASESITIRFFSFQKQLDTPPHLQTDSYKKATINSIKSGQIYSNCQMMINGYDRFGSITYRTDENLLENLNITPSASSTKYSNTFQISSYQGFLCFNGSFQRNQMPLPISFDYNLISSFDMANYDPKERVFSVQLRFSKCAIGERMTDDFKCLPCSKGTFSFEFQFSSFSDICQSCDSQDFYCFGGGNYTVKPGHWRMNKESIIFYKCPNHDACVGDPRNFTDPETVYNDLYSSSYCATGYTGILCAECEINYGFLDGYMCSLCHDEVYYLRVFSNLLLRIFFTLYLINISMNMCLSLSSDKPDVSRIIGTNLLKIFTNHLQILGIILNFPISFPKKLTEFTGYLLSVSPNVSEAFSIECILKKIPVTISLQYFKLIVAGIYPGVLVILYLFFINFMRNCKAYLNKRVGGIKSKDNINLTSKGALFRQGISYRNLAMTTFALVTLTCYADISKMTLSMFGCVEIGDGQISKKVLFTDFRIDCDGEYHKTWIKKLSSPVLVFFLVFYPIYIILSIVRGINNDNSSLFKFKFGYFFYAYKKKYFYWDFVILLRKLLLIFINSFFFSRITETIPMYPIVLVLFMMSLAYILQVNIRPWQVSDFFMINNIEELSLIISNFSIIISLLFLTSKDMSDEFITFLLIVMFLLNISFFIVWSKYYYMYYFQKQLKIMKIFNTLAKHSKPETITINDAKKPASAREAEKKTSQMETIQVKIVKKTEKINKGTASPKKMNESKKSPPKKQEVLKMGFFGFEDVLGDKEEKDHV